MALRGAHVDGAGTWLLCQYCTRAHTVFSRIPSAVGVRSDTGHRAWLFLRCCWCDLAVQARISARTHVACSPWACSSYATWRRVTCAQWRCELRCVGCRGRNPLANRVRVRSSVGRSVYRRFRRRTLPEVFVDVSKCSSQCSSKCSSQQHLADRHCLQAAQAVHLCSPQQYCTFSHSLAANRSPHRMCRWCQGRVLGICRSVGARCWEVGIQLTCLPILCLTILCLLI